jgi:hypothetical protein
LTSSPDLEGTLELVVEGDGERPERRYRLTLAGGRVDISERDASDAPAATASGSQEAWVRALGPDGTADELTLTGRRALVDAVLQGFTAAAARRAAA